MPLERDELFCACYLGAVVFETEFQEIWVRLWFPFSEPFWYLKTGATRALQIVLRGIGLFTIIVGRPLG